MISIEKENTFRALSDQPLLAKKQWHCACNIHTWLPWSEPINSKRGVYEVIEQYRACGYCNKVQRRELCKF